MEKLVLRLLHFIIYSLMLVSKFLVIKFESVLSSLQYTAYWIYYMGDDDAMVQDLCSVERLQSLGATKKLTNIGIVVNGLVKPGEKHKQSQSQDDKISLRLEESLTEYSDDVLESISKIINWILLTQEIKTLNIFDQDGILKDNSSKLKTNLQQTLKNNQRYSKTKCTTDNNAIDISVQVKTGGDVISKQKHVKINFLTEQDNTNAILKKAKQLSKKYKKDKIKETSKIKDYPQYEQMYFECQEPKDQIPQLLLVFNSPRRVLKLPGFPCLMKEVAEILECGQLSGSQKQFGPIQFINSIEKFQSIEQRWGK